jgi:small nuclear ribonucleoprotein (snRNP)-like protein
MEKQLLPALAVLVFCVLYTAAIAAQSKAQGAPASPERTRAEVHRLGFGKRVTVKLHNGAKVRGRITGLSNDQFVVSDSKTGNMSRVAFAEVAEIRQQREMGGLKGPFMGLAVTAAIVGSVCVLVLAFLN